MTAEEVAALFRGPEGYRFARWRRPIVPVVFGVEEATLAIAKGAVEAIVALAGHRMAETDPEMGANLMMFFLRDWAELRAVPDLGRMIPGLEALVPRLEAEGARIYRAFRFEPDGAIRAAFVFIRLDAALAERPAEEILLEQAAQAILLWGDGAFAGRGPLAAVRGRAVLRPEVAGLIRAAYDPVLPAAARDPAHALRLSARLALPGPPDPATPGRRPA